MTSHQQGQIVYNPETNTWGPSTGGPPPGTTGNEGGYSLNPAPTTGPTTNPLGQGPSQQGFLPGEGYSPINIPGTGFLPIIPGNEESSENAVFRMLRDQISASRARFNEIGKTTGATEELLMGALKPLEGQLGAIDQLRGQGLGIEEDLISSSLGSTAGAGVAAANAARLSGSGRLGGGGNAARMAARGATDAAVGQSGALSRAIVQGKLGEANYQSGLLQQRGGVSAALSQLLQGQAGLREDRARLGVANENQAGQLMLGALDVFGGISNARTSQQGGGLVTDLLGWLL